VFYFHNNGDYDLYLSSADWMDRNFFMRVEVGFPIDDQALRNRIVKEGLELYLADNTQAWVLHKDGDYRRVKPASNQKPRNAQATLLETRAPPG
jgi:polyphosphate kinase